ncbi:MAG: hypothetical protein ACI9WU_003854 [Myxococcota bacterium]|jgi:hypothetical protein
MSRAALLACWVLSGCATAQSSPGNVFEAYLEAYAEGDAPRMWELSSPSARADGRRVRDELVALLQDPDPIQRVQVEGRFGASSHDVIGMNDQQFFVWGVAAIRRRLGAKWIQQAVSSWALVTVAPTAAQAALVVYREPSGQLQRMPVIQRDNKWYVDVSPFPQEPAEAAPPE